MSAPLPTPTRRGRTRRWLIRLGLALGGIALIVLFVPMLLPGRLVGRLVAARIKSSLHLDATVESARFDLFRGLRVRGLAIAQSPQFGDGSLVRVARLSVRLTPATFLRGRPPRVAYLDGVELHVTRDEHGAWNLPEFTGQGMTTALLIRGGTLRLEDRRTGADQTLTLTQANISPPYQGFDSTFLCPGGGKLSFRGHVYTDDETGEFLALALWLEASEAPLDTFFALAAPRSRLRQALGDARVMGHMDVELRAERAAHIEAVLNLSRLPRLPWPSVHRARDAEGRVTVEADVSHASQHVEVHGEMGGSPNFQFSATLDNFLTDPKFAADLNAHFPLAPAQPETYWRSATWLSLSAKAKGTLDRVDISGQCRLTSGMTILGLVRPDVAFSGAVRPLALSAELSWTGSVGDPIRPATTKVLSGQIEVRAVFGAEPKIGPDGRFPPMVVRGWADLNLDFSLLSPGFNRFLGLPAPLPPKGTLQARSTIALGDDAATFWSDLASGFANPAEAVGGGAWRLALALRSKDLPLSHDSWPLSGTPLLNVASAALGGRPERLSFISDATGLATTSGSTLDEFKDNLAGQVHSDLREYRVAGAPLLTLLAALSRRPGMKEMVFETATANLQLRRGEIEHDLTLNREQGAFVVSGTGTLDGSIRYRVTVRNPKGISFLPADLSEYFEAGLPAMLIGGTVDAPKARIATESIAAFKLKQAIRRAQGKGN